MKYLKKFENWKKIDESLIRNISLIAAATFLASIGYSQNITPANAKAIKDEIKAESFETYSETNPDGGEEFLKKKAIECVDLLVKDPQLEDADLKDLLKITIKDVNKVKDIIKTIMIKLKLIKNDRTETFNLASYYDNSLKWTGDDFDQNYQMLTVMTPKNFDQISSKELYDAKVYLAAKHNLGEGPELNAMVKQLGLNKYRCENICISALKFLQESEKSAKMIDLKSNAKNYNDYLHKIQQEGMSILNKIIRENPEIIK